jgi:hypothetical protein
VVLAHGLRLVESTLREEDQTFRCSVFEGNVREEAPLAYRVISDGVEALTCLEAQIGAYNYANFYRSDEKTTVFDLAWSFEGLVSL